ncbi:uncharacterized protein ACHE_11856S [Aspergillus chevalieri]|uniref:Uncharacterized protein n=1 Tax=Aspergillus chevalieri TaxID=182096 RepID=A0A7R7ZKC4_ASPCH|nr:uncharacterized protein ACHE_11856S [Aspergillus chevalieri]BCR84454.1 hypothetical protein ACHE_11856S [Aspergillus chevalieri]
MGLDTDRYEEYELDWLASTMAINSGEVLVASRALDNDMEDTVKNCLNWAFLLPRSARRVRALTRCLLCGELSCISTIKNKNMIIRPPPHSVHKRNGAITWSAVMTTIRKTRDM